MERLGIDLVEERRVVAVAVPAEALGYEELIVHDPADGGKVDDLPAAVRAGVFRAFDELPDRTHNSGILHLIFESIAYAAAAALYAHLRGRDGDPLSADERWKVVLAAALGALVGSRLLAAVADLPGSAGAWRHPLWWVHGKTIVGGLLGGWGAVELVKARTGIRARTGDLFAAPLALGIAIGRIGCFLSGPGDHTAGRPTSLPWGISIDGGVRRHPVALYEIAFLLLLLPALRRRAARRAPGEAFRLFLGAYLLFRLIVDFWKPEPPPIALGLTAIQWACVLGIVPLLARRESHASAAAEAPA